MIDEIMKDVYGTAENNEDEQPVQTNFRLLKSDAEVFRKWCQGHGFAQHEGFGVILEMLSQQELKADSEDLSRDINNFESHLRNAGEAYMHMVRLVKDTEAEFEAKYNSKIELYEEKIEAQKAEIKAKDEMLAIANTRMAEAENASIDAVKEKDTAEKACEQAEAIAKDKAEIAEMLATKLKEAEQKLEGYPELQEKLKALENNVVEKTNALLNAKSEMDALAVSLTNEKEKVLSELQHKLEVAEVQREKEIAKLKLDHQMEIGELKDRLAEQKEQTHDLITAHRQRDAEADEQIRELEEKVRELEAQLKTKE